MKPKHAWFVGFLLVAMVALTLVTFDASSPFQTPEHTETPPSSQKVQRVELVQPSDDTVRNPYAPPVRHPPQDQYAQMGYLELVGSTAPKVPLFGKPCPTQRRKWLYYAIQNGIKLPVEVKGRNCTVSPGCDELQSGDPVKVDGHPYAVRLYETDMFEYDPFLIF
jgi:hypothetical protein